MKSVKKFFSVTFYLIIGLFSGWSFKNAKFYDEKMKDFSVTQYIASMIIFVGIIVVILTYALNN